MKLTQYQRQSLYNQHEILAKLETDEHMVKYHEQMQEIYNDGFESMYFEHGVCDDESVLDEAGCQQVLKILSMYDDLTFQWNNSDTLKENISEYHVKFPGFDLNDIVESKYHSFAKFLLIELGRYHDTRKMVSDDIDKLNSHGGGPGLDGYLDMLKRYNEIRANRDMFETNNNFTLEEIRKIINR